MKQHLDGYGFIKNTFFSSVILRDVILKGNEQREGQIHLGKKIER